MHNKVKWLALHVMGEVVGHAGGGGHEVVAAEEREEFGAGHEARITADGAEHTKQFGTSGIFCWRDGLEVGCSVVGSDAVEMVHDEAIGDRSYPRQMDGMRHKDVQVSAQGVLKLQVALFTIGIAG